MDVHDIARSARTYGVARYFVVTPLPTQREIAWRIRGFWTEGERAAEKSRRGEALEIVWVASDLEETLDWIQEAEGESPFLVATSAQDPGGGADLLRGSEREAEPGEAAGVHTVRDGMGNGRRAHRDLRRDSPSPHGASDFNHLSVRAAAAIVLDRVRGED